MHFRPLPPTAAMLCRTLGAPVRLVRHLTLVHDSAIEVLDGLERDVPAVQIDRNAVLLGAATHDLGKTIHLGELTGPGHLHERDGPALLEQHGLSREVARFARTHGSWRTEDVGVEDLLVAAADTVWRGARDEQLDDRLTASLAERQETETWATFATLDALLTHCASGASSRLRWAAEEF